MKTYPVIILAAVIVAAMSFAILSHSTARVASADGDFCPDGTASVSQWMIANGLNTCREFNAAQASYNACVAKHLEVLPSRLHWRVYGSGTMVWYGVIPGALLNQAEDYKLFCQYGDQVHFGLSPCSVTYTASGPIGHNPAFTDEQCAEYRYNAFFPSGVAKIGEAVRYVIGLGNAQVGDTNPLNQ